MRWAPWLIRRLYEADAELVDEGGFALLARRETIRRVTERRCPKCSDPWENAWELSLAIGGCRVPGVTGQPELPKKSEIVEMQAPRSGGRSEA